MCDHQAEVGQRSESDTNLTQSIGKRWESTGTSETENINNQLAISGFANSRLTPWIAFTRQRPLSRSQGLTPEAVSPHGEPAVGDHVSRLGVDCPDADSEGGTMTRPAGLPFAVSLLVLGAVVAVGVPDSAAGPGALSVTAHEGQLNVGGQPGSYSNGNIHIYAEGDRINFRLGIEATAPGSGTLEVAFSGNVAGGSGCTPYLEQAFALGTHDGSAPAVQPISGTAPTVAAVGAPVADGSDWVQVLDVSFAGAGESQVYYHLELSSVAAECGGSSQGTRIGATTGDFVVPGSVLNVPVPAKDLIDTGGGPQIIIVKTTVPASSQLFTFTPSYGPSFQLGSGGFVASGSLSPGTYTVSESVPDAWALTAIQCDDGDSTGDLLTATVTVNLQAGENVRCLFTNTETPQPLTITDHEGQLKSGGAVGAYTNGNVVTYAETDPINFRFELAAVAAGAGTMEIRFSGNIAGGSGCMPYFEQAFTLGTHDGSAPVLEPFAGAVPTVAPVGPPTEQGNEWVQILDVDFPGPGTARVNYYLTLSDVASDCAGSSQHTRIGTLTGDFANAGSQNVPIPAKDVLEQPGTDVVPPTVVGVPDRQPNANGWYQAPVVIDWVATDPAPSSGTPTDPPDTVADVEGTHLYVSDPSCDPTGNCATGELTLSVDLSDPLISADVSPPPNGSGWHAEPVTVTFTCSDAVSGIDTCTDPVTVSTDGAGQTVTGDAVDSAGRTASATVSGINIDQTAPVVAFSGNLGTYGASDVIDITCTATDALSGVASATCPSVSGPAYDFVGSNTLNAEVVDLAGNAASAQTTFVVEVAEDDMDSLIDEFVEQAGVATSLQKKIDAVVNAPNSQAKAGAVTSFENEVASQVGVNLTQEEADILVALVAELC